VYASAVLAVAMVFLAYQVRSYHVTFAERGFFWIGDVHRDDAIGFSMRPDRDGFAVLAGGVDDAARRIPVRTDPNGFRIPRSEPAAPVRGGGVVAIGCSCTYGHGVAAESSYVYQAGQLLGLEPCNLGVCAYSSVTSLLLLERHIERLQPRVVVYGFGNFHLERSAGPRAGADLFQAYAVCDAAGCRIEPPVLDNRLVFATEPAIERLYYAPRLAGDKVGWSVERVRTLLPLAGQSLRRTLHPAVLRLHFAPAALPDTVFCRFLLRRLYDDCRAHEAEFVLLWFPKELGDRPAPGLVAAAAELGGLPGFTFVDCSPALFAGMGDPAAYAARWQVPHDGHPNGRMHLEMARAIAAAIGPRLRSPPGAP
jgi:hypothetical protein